MKIWSETLTCKDLLNAAEKVNSEFPGANVYPSSDASLYAGPRTRRIDHVHLRSATGRHYPNSGGYGALHVGEMAASWTEWGWFIARVFEIDPDARVGDYKGVDDFNRQTHDRFIEPRSPRDRQVKRALRRVS